MASASITRLKTASGTRFRVRYRRGGRMTKLKHGGSFRTLRDARLRRDLISGELAAGRDPAEALRQQPEPRKVETQTLRAIAARFESSRVHMSPNGRKNIGSHLPRILGTFGDRDPQTIGFGEIQDWIAANTKAAKSEGGLEPSSLSRYFATLRQLLDFAGVDPNPARDRRVKLPAIISEEPDPPTAAQLQAILERVGARWLLPLIVLEQAAMRAGEAAQLVWGDVDVAESKFRLPRRSTKSRRPRWVQVPEWLMDRIAATCPLEDRTAERRVFCLPTLFRRRSREGDGVGV